jgi:hypothetical protein
MVKDSVGVRVLDSHLKGSWFNIHSSTEGLLDQDTPQPLPHDM